MPSFILQHVDYIIHRSNFNHKCWLQVFAFAFFLSQLQKVCSPFHNGTRQINQSFYYPTYLDYQTRLLGCVFSYQCLWFSGKNFCCCSNIHDFPISCFQFWKRMTIKSLLQKIWFRFSIVYFLFMCINMTAAHAYRVYISITEFVVPFRISLIVLLLT